jgi:hypothetical protein
MEMIISYVENGISKERVATPSEEKHIKEMQAMAQLSKDAELAELASRDEAKAALLNRLGITEDEAKLLLA